MPPFDLWLNDLADIGKWYTGQGAGCENSRMIATRANGCAAFAQYKPAAEGRWEPWALQVVEVGGGRITGIHHWIPPFAGKLFEAFGMPPYLEGDIPFTSERRQA